MNYFLGTFTFSFVSFAYIGNLSLLPACRCWQAKISSRILLLLARQRWAVVITFKTKEWSVQSAMAVIWWRVNCHVTWLECDDKINAVYEDRIEMMTKVAGMMTNVVVTTKPFRVRWRIKVKEATKHGQDHCWADGFAGLYHRQALKNAGRNGFTRGSCEVPSQTWNNKTKQIQWALDDSHHKSYNRLTLNTVYDSHQKSYNRLTLNSGYDPHQKSYNRLIVIFDPVADAICQVPCLLKPFSPFWICSAIHF